MKKLYVIYKLLPAMVFVLMVFGPFAANLFYSNTELLDCLLYTSDAADER